MVVSAQGLEAVSQDWRLEGHPFKSLTSSNQGGEGQWIILTVINYCCAGASEQGISSTAPVANCEISKYSKHSVLVP